MMISVNSSQTVTESMPAFDGIRGVLCENEPMSSHTSWRVGGAADCYFVPADVRDLKMFLRQLPNDIDVIWTGLGSNLLVRDGGIRGVVIATQKGLNGLTQIDSTSLQAEVGVTGAKLARFSTSLGLHGAEFMAGIPGTVGGALAMNAGAWGQETWSIVSSVKTIDRNATIRTRDVKEFDVGYRHVALPDRESFLSAHLTLEPGNEGEGVLAIRRLLDERAAAQPVQSANAGSVFRNPEGDFAARLIEASGLKGFRKGAAGISDKHANFIINFGGATADEIESLIEYTKETVMESHGVLLVPEVRIVGEALDA